MNDKLKLAVLSGTYSIYRISPGAELPDGICESEFCSITRTSDELSVVTARNDSIPDNIMSDHDWKVLRIQGQLDFGLVGIISGIASVLAETGIAVFVISTYNTDYILVKEDKLDAATRALEENGYSVSPQ